MKARQIVEEETPKQFLRRKAVARTLFTYGYRDASNYKVNRVVALHGTIPDATEQFMHYANAMDPGDFLPGQVGLEPLQSELASFPSEDDHVFHYIISVVPVPPGVDDGLTVAELLYQFKRAHEVGWYVSAEMDRVGLSWFK